MTENGVAAIVVDAAVEVHRTMGGPGLIEAVYEQDVSRRTDRVVDGFEQ